MKLFLRLKHWQLFLLSWGTLSACIGFVLFDPFEVLKYLKPWFWVTVITTINSFAWIWTVVMHCIRTAPPELPIHIKRFKIAFWIPALFLTCFALFVIATSYFPGVDNFHPDAEANIIRGWSLLSVLSIFYGAFFAARVLKAAELKREPKLREYLLYILLILLAPLGIWVLQPRVNRLNR